MTSSSKIKVTEHEYKVLLMLNEICLDDKLQKLVVGKDYLVSSPSTKAVLVTCTQSSPFNIRLK